MEIKREESCHIKLNADTSAQLVLMLSEVSSTLSSTFTLERRLNWDQGSSWLNKSTTSCCHHNPGCWGATSAFQDRGGEKIHSWLYEKKQLSLENLQAYVMEKLLAVSTMSTCGTSLGTSWCCASAKRNTSYSWAPVGKRPPVEKRHTATSLPLFQVLEKNLL